MAYKEGQASVYQSDNGPEFTSTDFALWCASNNISIQFIQPGKCRMDKLNVLMVATEKNYSILVYSLS
ncbi:MAG: hypothetical protein BGO70_03510 [Bacteroidetes bacterium 43-93]|nr:MAG: hypothetical protein BGO70_03510 [Bacteroidetes bacterium 43-93]